jgi:beta-galactosidase
MADFAFMGGLYRPAWLIETEVTRFSLDDCGSEGVYIKQKSLTSEKVDFDVEALITRASSSSSLTCRCVIYSPQGELLLQQEKIIESDKLLFSFSLRNPHLWAGSSSPKLYQVNLSLSHAKEERDQRSIISGFRTPQVDPEKGFILNGQIYPLRGISRHQDRRDSGWAIKKDAMEEDIKLIKEMGANAIRLAHYQHIRSFYQLCDREGFIVWAEIPYISRTSREDKTGGNALLQLEELIKQNYNSPSICFWGLQNEITIGGKKDWARKITTKLHELAKNLDPLRLTSQSQVGHYKDEGSLNNVTDCLGYNKYFGWYYGKCSDMNQWLTIFASKHPKIALAITEYGADGLTAYHNDQPRQNDYSEEYQALYHEKMITILQQHPRLWGTFVWNMFDFASPMRDEGGVKGMNNKGLVTYDRTTKKDAYYIYKAFWNKDPMIHITGKNYLKRRGKTIDLKIYTNQLSVILDINGKTWAESPVEGNKAFFTHVPLKRRGITNIKVRAIGKEGEMCHDRAQFYRVRKKENTYICPEKDPYHFLKNWFEGETTEEAPPLKYPKGYLSIKEKIRIILKYPEGEAVIHKYAGPLYDHPMFPMAKSFTPEKLAAMRPGTVPDSFLARLNDELNEIKM